MLTNYDCSDGDYIDDADYTKLINDIQRMVGYDIGEFLEICVTLESDNTIGVLGANDEGDEWEWGQYFNIPPGWDIELIKRMFVGTVYMIPDGTVSV